MFQLSMGQTMANSLYRRDAAIVHLNSEKNGVAKLDKMGVANYVPVQQEEHQWSD